MSKDIVVLFPFDVPVFVPRLLTSALRDGLAWLRIVPRRHGAGRDNGRWTRLRLPLNYMTAPLVAALFLLAVSAIGRREVHDGTVGDDHIKPLDIMVFFITLAYIAISIDASGLIRFLAFKVLQWGGDVGHRLFFYLYAFFFLLGTFIGNDPIILSGTAFLAYMTRVSSNIVHPRAWIYTQFAVANIASAVLVSSNPTNLVLAGAFGIRFIDYTANMVVPVVATAILLFPFLLYIVFANESLIPIAIRMHELPEEARVRKPVNPNIPHAAAADGRPGELVLLGGDGGGSGGSGDVNPDAGGRLLPLEEIMNPFLDRGGAAVGAVIMTVTLATILAINAAEDAIDEQRLYYITVPAATVMVAWDLAFGWLHRRETREIARKGRDEVARARAEAERNSGNDAAVLTDGSDAADPPSQARTVDGKQAQREKTGGAAENHSIEQGTPAITKKRLEEGEKEERPTLVSLASDAYQWCRETFPTFTAVVAHLPFALIPFAFSMFVLVQALVTKGWVEVFAHGWDNWVTKTGTGGGVGAMGFLAVVLCNVGFPPPF